LQTKLNHFFVLAKLLHVSTGNKPFFAKSSVGRLVIDNDSLIFAPLFTEEKHQK